MCIGSFSPNIMIAQILSPLITVLFMLFGGFYVNTDNIPVYYIWLYYLSFFNYSFQILCYNEFGGWGEPLQFECSSSQIVSTIIISQQFHKSIQNINFIQSVLPMEPKN